MLMKGVFKSENSGVVNVKLAGVRISDGNEGDFSSCIVAFPEVETTEKTKESVPSETKKGKSRSKSVDAVLRKAYPVLPLDANESYQSKKVCKELSCGENIPIIITNNAFPLTGITNTGVEFIKSKKENLVTEVTSSNVKQKPNTSLVLKKGNICDKKCVSNLTPKRKDPAKPLKSDSGEWLISFSTYDNNLFKTIPSDVFQPNYPLEIQEDVNVQRTPTLQCDKEKSFLTLPNAKTHLGKKYGYLRPLSADFKTKYPCLWNTHKPTETQHVNLYTSVTDSGICITPDSFPSLGFEAVGVYSVKQPPEKPRAIEDKPNVSSILELEQSKLLPACKESKTIQWTAKEELEDVHTTKEQIFPGSSLMLQLAKKAVTETEKFLQKPLVKSEKELIPQVDDYILYIR